MPSGKSVRIREGQSVLDTALANKVRIATSCGGMGTCGTCRVFIEGNQNLVSPRNEIEEEIATDRKFKDNERLACQIDAVSGLCVRVPE